MFVASDLEDSPKFSRFELLLCFRAGINPVAANGEATGTELSFGWRCCSVWQAEGQRGGAGVSWCQRCIRGVRGLQGYLAHTKLPPPRTIASLCLGTWGGPVGWGAISCERDTPAAWKMPASGEP